MQAVVEIEPLRASQINRPQHTPQTTTRFYRGSTWSRTRFQPLLKPIEFGGPQLCLIESFECSSLKSSEACCFQAFSPTQNRLHEESRYLPFRRDPIDLRSGAFRLLPKDSGQLIVAQPQKGDFDGIAAGIAPDYRKTLILTELSQRAVQKLIDLS